MYNKALKIAYKAHRGQTRNDGSTPYIVHPWRVANCFTDDVSKSIAILHDVVEDTDITINDLVARGFGLDVILALEALTRQKDEQYFDYIKRLKENDLAIEIKIADIIDNLSDTVQSDTMIERYNKTLDVLIKQTI